MFIAGLFNEEDDWEFASAETIWDHCPDSFLNRPLAIRPKSLSDPPQKLSRSKSPVRRLSNRERQTFNEKRSYHARMLLEKRQSVIKRSGDDKTANSSLCKDHSPDTSSESGPGS